jgi:hypothetical protein
MSPRFGPKDRKQFVIKPTLPNSFVEVNMHFAVAIVTNEKPTEAILAETLAPFGPAAGVEAKWDWQALGGRFTGLLCPKQIAGTVTGGVEYPDDELPLRPILQSGPGVDAVQNGNLETFNWTFPPRVLVIDGQWLEAQPLTVDFGGSVLRSLYLGDIDRSAPVLSGPEMLLTDDWFERFYGILDNLAG